MSDSFLQAQLLVLVVVFVLACAGKLHSPWNRMAVCYALAEGTLAVVMIATTAPWARWGAALMLGAATWVVGELRVSRPDDGCGCFGRLSRVRIGYRTVARTGLLAVVAIAACGAPVSAWAELTNGPGLAEAVALVELLAFVAVSPESTAFARRASLPCERRPVPLPDTLRVLHASAVWREHGRGLGEPAEVWRELCWRFLVYRVPGGSLVFAVSLGDREVRAARVPDAEPAPGWTAPLAAPVLVRARGAERAVSGI